MRKLLLALVLLLAACGHSWRGEVIDKWYEPAHDTHSQRCTWIGKVMVCHPEVTHHPDKWFLKIRNCEQSECQIWVDRVSHELYDSIQIGTTVVYPTPTPGESN